MRTGLYVRGFPKYCAPSQRKQSLIGNFRLQANLARLNLPYPEAVFDIGFFKRNPRPCKPLPLDVYTLAQRSS
jgi:hypothetical protein